MILVSFISAFLGFASLSMAMKRHFRQIWPDGRLHILKVIILRLIGSGLLLISSLLCVGIQGFGIGVVLWFGLLTFSALLVSLLLTYQSLLKRTLSFKY